MTRAQAIASGQVPPGCEADDAAVAQAIGAGDDPCRNCRGPRHRCGGRPFGGESPRVEARSVRDVYFFEGVDAAPSEGARSDDGALVVGCARPRFPKDVEPSQNEADWFFDYIYARRLTSRERASARQWAAIIHEHHLRFGFEKIVLDPGGGGLFVQRELKSPKQFIGGAEREVTPIVDQVNGPHEVVRGHFILHLFKRGDPGIESLWPGLAGDDNLNDAAYSEMKLAIDHGLVGFPPHPEDCREAMRSWPPERVEAMHTLNEMFSQFCAIAVQTRDDGSLAITKRGARQFFSSGKKDLVSAAIYCYLGFRMWLRSEDWLGPRLVGETLFSVS